MQTVTKRQLIDRVAGATGVARCTARAIVAEFLDQMTAVLARGERLELRDFGIFEPQDRASRVARNPQTHQQIVVPPRRGVRFKPGQHLRDRLEPTADRPIAEVAPARRRPRARPGRGAGTPSTC